MYHTSNNSRVIGLALSTAMTGALLSGCATTSVPTASASAGQAEAALAQGKYDRAIDLAEAAVLAEPYNAEYRATLAHAYLEAGRFTSASTTFDDAMRLGDNSPRTALSLAISLTGEGKLDDAAALLREWQDDLDTADLGLALTLSGQPQQAIHVMSNAIRGGQNTVKMRQNLAYSYAMAGRWREARLMAAQDVPADKLGARLEEWATMARPDAWQQRVATLIEVPAGVRDAGQPTMLALADVPATRMAEVEEEPQAAVPPAPTLAEAELPALATAADAVPPASLPAPKADSFRAAFASPARQDVAQDAAAFAKPAPAAKPAKPVARAARAEGTHLVQLGSFSSEQSARKAWKIYTQRYPGLAGHRMVLSEAVVGGKRFWRVSAAGFEKAEAGAMCSRVKARGSGCFAYVQSRPLPGAIDAGTRVAMR